jgi:hypothetical protein
MKRHENFAESALALFICIMGAVVVAACSYLLIIIIGSNYFNDGASDSVLHFLSPPIAIIAGAGGFVIILRKIRTL